MIIDRDENEKSGIINYDSGFAFGRGLFETILVKKRPVLLKEHLHRLNNGLSKIGINKFISKEYFMENLKKMQSENCAVKIMVSEKNIVFTKREVTYTDKHYEEGFSLVVSEVRRNPYSRMTYVKSFNYMDNIIEREIAKKKGFDEVLFLNTDNFVSEGSVSNIFYVKDNKIFTPNIESGLLAGIIREFLINNMKKYYSIHETKVTLEELLEADGVFITNSLMGVMKVRSINNEEVNQSKIISDIRNFYEEFIQNFS